MKKKRRTEKLYVVGFHGKGQDALYSNVAWSHPEGDGGICMMTYAQAKREVKNLQGGETAIFKLVPIWTSVLDKLIK